MESNFSASVKRENNSPANFLQPTDDGPNPEGDSNDHDEQEVVNMTIDMEPLEQLLPDDYEERPLEFDDFPEDQEEDDADDQDAFDNRSLVIDRSPSETGSGNVAASKSGKVKMYRCSYCQFTCNTASRFHVHFVQHLNTKPFMCSVSSDERIAH